MRDEMDSRMWNEHHEDFSASIADAIDKLRAVFKQIHRHNFCAPWDEPCDSQR
jgi:phage gp16-like protein